MPRTISTVLIAAVVAILAAAGTVAAQTSQRFDDVPQDAYYHDAVNWAVDAGITVGCGDGSNFCPGRTLTRAETVTFLHRYHQAFGPPTVVAPVDCDSAVERASATIAEVGDLASGGSHRGLGASGDDSVQPISA